MVEVDRELVGAKYKKHNLLQDAKHWGGVSLPNNPEQLELQWKDLNQSI